MYTCQQILPSSMYTMRTLFIPNVSVCVRRTGINNVRMVSSVFWCNNGVFLQSCKFENSFVFSLSIATFVFAQDVTMAINPHICDVKIVKNCNTAEENQWKNTLIFDFNALSRCNIGAGKATHNTVISQQSSDNEAYKLAISLLTTLIPQPCLWECQKYYGRERESPYSKCIGQYVENVFKLKCLRSEFHFFLLYAFVHLNIKPFYRVPKLDENKKWESRDNKLCRIRTTLYYMCDCVLLIVSAVWYPHCQRVR